jgi:SAUR family protein
MKQLLRQLSFSPDRARDGGGGSAMKKEPMRRFSFSDRARDGSGAAGATKKEPMRRWFSFSDRVSDSGGVPRGCVPVLVCGGDVYGEGEGERFVVRVEALRHPSFAGLLEDAAQEFGYKQEGVLRVPCAVHQFRDVLAAVPESSPRAKR